MKREKVLISGGAGFIGSHLANTLHSNGDNILVIDNLSKGNEGNLDPHIKLIKEDIRELKIKEIIKKFKPDIFYHLAAQSNLQASLLNSEQDIMINFIPIIAILDALKDSGCKKFIFASSAAVYQESAGKSLKETENTCPSTPYGISKLASENYIKFFYKMNNLPYAILRFSNVYGPKQDDSSEGGVVSIFIKNSINGKRPTIFGDGNQTRDFIFVTDVVNALKKSQAKSLIGTYNVSTNKETTINELYSLIIRKLKSRYKPIFKKSNLFDVKKSRLSYSLIKKRTKWTPKTSLTKGLDLTINYFQ